MSDRTRIDWCDATINPWGWGCWGPGGSAENPRRCTYCYAARLASRKLRKCPDCQAFVPHWHGGELLKPLQWKRPRRIFVGSMSDPFGDWVTYGQLDQVFDMMADCDQHTFYLLTKQPQNIMEKLYNGDGNPPFIMRRALPRNVWLGASVDTQERASATVKPMFGVVHAGWHTFVSIKPMLTEIDWIDVCWADWVIMGAESGPAAARHKPQRGWIEDIIAHSAAYECPVFLKSSITTLWPDLVRREWPEEGS